MSEIAQKLDCTERTIINYTVEFKTKGLEEFVRNKYGGTGVHYQKK